MKGKRLYVRVIKELRRLFTPRVRIGRIETCYKAQLADLRDQLAGERAKYDKLLAELEQETSRLKYPAAPQVTDHRAVFLYVCAMTRAGVNQIPGQASARDMRAVIVALLDQIINLSMGILDHRSGGRLRSIPREQLLQGVLRIGAAMERCLDSELNAMRVLAGVSPADPAPERPIGSFATTTTTAWT